jgi:diguanylate cyclase (GGDEF)-like protein
MSMELNARAFQRRLQRGWVQLRRPGRVLAKPLRLGIGSRLAIAFAGVAVLAVAANLFAEHGLTIASLTSGHDSSAALDRGKWLRESVAQASGAISESIKSFDQATETRMRLNTARGTSSLAKSTGDLDRELRAYVTAARAFAQPLSLDQLARRGAQHLEQGATLVREADQRRTLASEYSSILDDITKRVEDSANRSWKFLGHLVARQSLVELTHALGSMRIESARLLAGDSSDRIIFDAVTHSETRFLSLLEMHAGELVRTEGAPWLSQMRVDVQRLRVIQSELGALDGKRTAALWAFRTAGLALVDKIHEIDTTPPERATSTAERQLKQEGSRLAAKLSQEGRSLLWISAAVLLLVLVLSVATTLSIVHPVRRFSDAMRRLANGDSSARMARGGIKEIDALAVEFNQMARSIAVYQRQLESTVNERTFQFRHLEDHDPLTQLPNRSQLLRYLRGALEVSKEATQTLGVLFIDIDNFKTINDSKGHAFGDQVLIAIANRVREVVGEAGFIARLGGDEFALVYGVGQGGSSPVVMGNRLLQAFSSPLHVDGHELSIGISVGASVFPEHADTAEGLLSAADAALFHAKASGRRQLSLFSPGLLEEASFRFRIEQGLRHAMDRGEFELLFQPEVSLKTFSTSALEALLRWRMPDGTQVSPATFLPVAEQSGLILEIGDWVLRHAIKTTAGWYHAGRKDVRVAINVSARELLTPGFVRHVRALLEIERLPATAIELELTETSLQTDPSTIDVLRAVRAENIGVALDDFGTGYSTLASLEQLPLTRVKLDRSLIARIHANPRSLAISESITRLCHRLGLEVTAEGVENLPQLASLSSEGTLAVQGFLIAKPAPADQVLSLIKTMNSRMSALLEQVREPDEEVAVLERNSPSRRKLRLRGKGDRD